MMDLGLPIVTFLVGLVLAAFVPSRAQCPEGWNLNEGVRRDGNFACYAPLPKCCGDAKGECETPCPRVDVTRSRIYCTNGMRPIVIDSRTVGCQR